MRNLESTLRRFGYTLRFHTLRIKPTAKPRVAVMVTDPRMFTLLPVVKNLQAFHKLEILLVFAVFYHAQSDALTPQLRSNLAKRLRSEGFSVLETSSASEMNQALSFLKRSKLIITSQPYVYPDRRLNTWNFPAKVLYVPYTLWSNKRLDLKAGEGISRCKGSAMLESRWHVEDYERTCRHSRLKGLHCGFPRLFELSQLDFRRTEKQDRETTITWAPHWSSLRSEDSSLAISLIAQSLATFVEGRPDLRLIFRPHPLFDEYLANADFTIHTSKVIDSLLELRNVDRGDSLSVGELFRLTDVLVHNSGSFLAEFSITGKPMIFSKVPNDFIFSNLSSFGSTLADASYEAGDGDELIGVLQDLLNGFDPKKELRMRAETLIRESLPGDPNKVIAREGMRLLRIPLES